MRLTWGEFFDARENDAVRDELFDVDDHGDSTYELVIKRDGRFYRTSYIVIKEDGVMTDHEDHVDFVEVTPVEMLVVVYEPVADPPWKIAKPREIDDPDHVEEYDAEQDDD